MLVRGERTPGDACAEKTKVLVVDDHQTFSDLLGLALSAEPDLEFVGAGHSVSHGLDLAARLEPDVVVMDVHVGEGDGLAATAELTRRLPATRVVVVTAFASRPMLDRAIAAGACALLPKDGSLADLLGAVRASHSDGFWVHPRLMRRLVAVPGAADSDVPVDLTQREDQVLRLLAEGMDARAISKGLGISIHTCRGHVRSLLAKLGAHSQLEAVAIAKRRGLLSGERAG